MNGKRCQQGPPGTGTVRGTGSGKCTSCPSERHLQRKEETGKSRTSGCKLYRDCLLYTSRTFHYEGGIKEFVSYLNRSATPLYEQIIYCEGMVNNVSVEVAMQHNDSYSDNTYGFVNNITTPEGGTHVVGFRNAITKTFNDYARKNKLLRERCV